MGPSNEAKTHFDSKLASGRRENRKNDSTTIFGRISESRNLGNFRVFEMNTTAEMLEEPVATVNEKFLSVRIYGFDFLLEKISLEDL